MSYVSQSHANRPAAIAGVIGIHAGLGALIVLGLSTDVVTRIIEPNIDTFDVTNDPPPPPPPTERAKKPKVEDNSSVIYVPPRNEIILPSPNFVDTTDILPPLSDTVILEVLPPLDNIEPPVAPAFEPKAASPRNNPARWVTDTDYKSRWIREGLSGTARFKLEVGVSGKVESCQITKSTGHSVLDQATCQLASKRARFKPATDGDGQKASGSYTNSIRWKIPD